MSNIVLPAAGFLGKLTETEREILTSYGSIITFEKGSNLLEQGQRQEYLFVLLSGRFQIEIPQKIGQAKKIVLSAVTVVGEIGIFCSHTATASVSCLDRCEFWMVHEKKIDALCAQNPAVAATFFRNILPIVIDRYFKE